MNKIKEYSLPALSGLLLALSFPSAGLSILAWFAFVPLFISLNGNGRAESFWRGFAAGLVFYLVSVRWVINTMHRYGGLDIFVSILLLIALSAYLALYFGAFAWLVARVREKAPCAWMWFAPALWVSLELLRNYLLSGFPWNLLGYSQAGRPLALQVADVTGVYGVSFLVMLSNSALAIMAASFMKRKFSPKAAAWPAAAMAVIALAVFGYGGYRLAHLPPEAGRLKVALVQGNIEQFHKWDPAYRDEVFSAYKRLTLLSARSSPGLIIWPETATPFFFQDDSRRAELFSLARASGAFIMTGSPTFEEDGEKVIEYNSAYLIPPDGGQSGRYDKMHLVPFGEYVPLKWLLPFVDKMVVGIGDFGRGRDYTLLDTGKGAFGTAICFEVIFPELVRHFALSGADFLASITNDAWFGDSAAPYQHFNMSILRAVENRRALVRVANTGISGIILPSGEVSARTGLFVERTLSGDVPLVREKTFYTRYGDVFAYACVVLSSIWIIWIRKERSYSDDSYRRTSARDSAGRGKGLGPEGASLTSRPRSGASPR